MEYKGFNIEIEQDLDPVNPREYDNLGTMVCFHRRYKLGDDHDFTDSEHLGDWLNDHRTDITALPIYLYDHSGITINTTGFSCQWDSGQIGYIYVDYDRMKEEGLPHDRAERILKAEVEEYDHFLTGAVYGYEVTPLPGNETPCDDSCWGFYGEQGKAEAISQAKSAIDYAISQRDAENDLRDRREQALNAFMRSSWAY